MKYITTKSNPIFKEGLKISNELYSTFNPYYNRKHDVVLLSDNDTVEFLKKGWIIEVEKPEFTKSDMKARCIEFAKICDEPWSGSYELEYTNWIKSKDK